jgi:hypothetical protein
MFPADRARPGLAAALVAVLLVGLWPASALAVGPIADDDHVAVPVNAPATTVDVLDGDVGDTLTIVSATDPAHGTVVVAPDGLSLTYQPDTDFHDTETFDYTITDGGTTDVGMVTVDVNSAPVAVDDPGAACQTPGTFGGAFPVTEDFINPVPRPSDAFILFGTCALLHNDTDADGDDLTWELVTQPANGEVVKIDEEFFAYTPDPDYSAADHGLPATDFDTFTYRAFDGFEYSAPATMRIWVTPVNDAPTFTPGPSQVVVGEDSGAYSAAWATDVSPGPPSESWQTVHFEADTPPNGVPDLFAVPPALDASGNLTFTPNPDEIGLVHVTIRAVDDGGLEDWQAPGQVPPDDTSDDVTFDIVVMPDAVSAVDDEATLPEDPTDPWLIDVLDNDSYPAEATVTAVTQGTLGLVTIAPDGLSVFYTPDPDADGTDSFTYTLDDGAGSTDTATVEVTVTPVNDTPVAGDDSAAVRVNGTAKPIAVLANDTDVDGDELQVTETSASLKGTVTITGGGTGLTYLPDTDESGADSFTYTISDGHGGSDEATVSVSIAENAHPIANDDIVTVLEDAAATTVDVLDDDTDPDADPFTITAASDPPKGTVVITGNGSGLTYKPDANANGADTFTYTIDDDHGGTDTATVSVTITPVNDDPVATTDTLTVAEDAAATAVAVLANDSDPDGDPKTITAKSNGAKGVVVITGGGNGLTYKPNLNANGSDSFTYTIGDGHGATDSATVNVTITPVNDKPDARNDTSFTVAQGTGAGALAVLVNDLDADGDTPRITAKTDGAHGTVVITGGGTGLTYNPAGLYYGTDVFHLHRERRPRRHRHRERPPDGRQGHAETGRGDARRDLPQPDGRLQLGEGSPQLERHRYRRHGHRRLQAPGQRQRRLVFDHLALKRDRDERDADARGQLDLSLPGAGHGQGRQCRHVRHGPDLQAGPGPEQQLGPRIHRAVDDVIERERTRREPPIHERDRSVREIHGVDARDRVHRDEDHDERFGPGVGRRDARGDPQPALDIDGLPEARLPSPFRVRRHAHDRDPLAGRRPRLPRRLRRAAVTGCPASVPNGLCYTAAAVSGRP